MLRFGNFHGVPAGMLESKIQLRAFLRYFRRRAQFLNGEPLRHQVSSWGAVTGTRRG